MIFQTTYYTLPHQTDFSKHITPQHLGSLILDTAGQAANNHGFGMSLLNETQNVAWVLSRFSVQIYAIPPMYSTITIRTWVRSINAVFTKRLFSISNEKDEIIAEADSLWSIINMQTRKVADLTAIPNIQNSIINKDISMSAVAKVPRENISNCKQYHHDIKFSDIDLNQHTNSMKYLQWCLDTLPVQFFKENNITRYDINFLKEMLETETATINKDFSPLSTVFCISNTENTPCCRIKLHHKSSK